jgi:hypothetical protein
MICQGWANDESPCFTSSIFNFNHNGIVDEIGVLAIEKSTLNAPNSGIRGRARDDIGRKVSIRRATHPIATAIVYLVHIKSCVVARGKHPISVVRNRQTNVGISPHPIAIPRRSNPKHFPAINIENRDTFLVEFKRCPPTTVRKRSRPNTKWC